MPTCALCWSKFLSRNALRTQRDFYQHIMSNYLNSEKTTSENLLREITRMGVAALALNGLIGAGIFALPAAAAERSGGFSPWMYIICGLLMSTVVLALGQAASYFRGTGGPILYARSAFGSMMGFQTGWLLYLGRVTAMAANTNALVAYATIFWDGLNHEVGRFLAILAVCLFFTTVNVIGVREGIRTTNILTIIKLLPIFLFIGVGLTYVQPEEFVTARPPAYEGFAATLLLLVYAFVGFEGALVPAGESKDPKRDIPRALLATIAVTAIIYLFVQTACMAVLPTIAKTETPLADVAEVMVGTPGAWIMTFAALMSIAGNLSAIMLTAPRMTYAMGRDKSLPPLFGKVHEGYKTPAFSIIFLGSLSFVLAVTGSFVWLAVMSSLTRMIGYSICIAALPRIKKRFSHAREALSLPGGFVIPALGLALCAWLAFQADLKSWLMTVAFIALGSGLYILSKKMSTGSEHR